MVCPRRLSFSQFVVLLHFSIVRQPSSSIWPRTQILISLSQSGHAAYFMVEYQFSIYIIEVFAKKINFKILSHTEYSFLNLGYYPILAIFLKSNSHA